MKRAWGLVLSMVLLAGCVVNATPEFEPYESELFDIKAVNKVRAHTCAVTVYFEVSSEVAADIKAKKSNPIWRGYQDRWKMMITEEAGNGNEFIVFIGAGTLLRDGYIITATHLITDSDPRLQQAPITVWVLFNGVDHPIKADIVAKTELSDGENFYQDYALLKLQEPLNRKGIELALRQPEPGSPVMYAGSTKGTAFFVRYGILTEFHKFFKSGLDGYLHLSYWTDFVMLCVYPGGPGDSGGGIFNADGELVGMMYCGIDLASTEYIFSNPLDTLKAFLRSAGYEIYPEEK